MKTSFLFPLILMLAATGCEQLEPGISMRRSGDLLSRKERGRTPRSGGVTDSTGAPVVIPPDGLFVTAVAYPEGYDWRRDTARGSVRGRVLLLRLRDGADAGPGPGAETSPAAEPDWGAGASPAAFDTILALEAGAGRAVSLDADRHQFTGGHLYTQCITEVGTIHRRDGQTVLISQEKEYLRGILTLDHTAGNSEGTSPSGSAGEALYTLSQRLDGEGGFVLRRGWKPLLIRTGGRIHGSLGEPSFGRSGALFADGGEACFFYENPEGEWILVRSGDGPAGTAGRDVREEPVALPEGINQLYDIRCYNGVICCVCQWKRREPVLFIGSKRYDLSTTLQTPAQKSGFRLLRAGSGIRFSGSVRLNYNQRLYTALWSEKSLLRTLEGRCDWLGGPGAEDLAYIRKEDGRVVAAGIGSTDYSLDNGGTLMMPQCAFQTGPNLYLALTGSGNVPPDVMAGLTGHLRFPVGAGNDGTRVGAGNDGTAAGPVLWHNGASTPLPLNGFPTSVTLLGNPPN